MNPDYKNRVQNPNKNLHQMKTICLIIIIALFASCQPSDDLEPVNPKAGAFQKTTFSDTTNLNP